MIRCDEQEYLVWKWRPAGQEINSTTRENSIRFGSSLRVKDGEVAVFVYKQRDGSNQDFIVGPFDETIKTANFPVLSKLMGLAFGGESPFQAEIYFINLAGNIQIKFGVPYFDVADPRFLDYVVPVSAGGSLTFNITDYKSFIKLNRLTQFTLDDFKRQIEDAVKRRVKAVISNAPADAGFPLVQIERKIDEINDTLKAKLKEDLEDFGVNLKRFDLSRITPDKESEGWEELRNVTAQQQTATINAQTAVNIKNLSDMQAINAANIEATLQVQREEAQRAQRLQTETQFIGAHALNRQADVLQTAATTMGAAGVIGGGSGGSGINPAQFMTGMAMGSAMGQQMAGMVNQMGSQLNNGFAAATNTPPAMPQVQFTVAINGQQYGPYNMQQLQQLQGQGQLTAQTLVWRQGMPSWVAAGQVPELSTLFAPPTPAGAPPIPGTGTVPPPMPPAPPMP